MKLKLTSFNADPADIAALHVVAREQGTQMASLLRQLIKKELRRVEKERQAAA